MHQPELDLAVALPAQVRRQVGRPQLLRLDLVLQRSDRPHETGVVGVEHLQGIDLFAHEVAHPVELAFELGLG